MLNSRWQYFRFGIEKESSSFSGLEGTIRVCALGTYKTKYILQPFDFS